MGRVKTMIDDFLTNFYNICWQYFCRLDQRRRTQSGEQGDFTGGDRPLASLLSLSGRFKGTGSRADILTGAVDADACDGIADPAGFQSFRRVRTAGLRIQYAVSVRGDREDPGIGPDAQYGAGRSGKSWLSAGELYELPEPGLLFQGSVRSQ